MYEKSNWRLAKEAEDKSHTRADWEMFVVGLLLLVSATLSAIV